MQNLSDFAPDKKKSSAEEKINKSKNLKNNIYLRRNTLKCYPAANSKNSF